MSGVHASGESAAGSAAVKPGEPRLEVVVVVPVSDVGRAKRFYEALGWRLDADPTIDDSYRVVQLTPPGSGCSIIVGKGGHVQPLPARVLISWSSRHDPGVPDVLRDLRRRAKGTSRRNRDSIKARPRRTAIAS